MKILITGGTGFIGSNLVFELAKQNHEIIVTGHDAEASLPPVAKFLNFHFTGIDWESLVDIDVVFHQGANNSTQIKDRKEMLLANYHGPMALFDKAYENGCRKFIYASSTAVYGNTKSCCIEGETPLKPLTPYGESKALFDQFAMEFAATKNINIIGLRYCNVYGPREDHKGKRMSMIGQMARKMIKGIKPKLFEHGEQQRDWIYVKDVIDANLLAMDSDINGIYNCGYGVAISFNEIVKIINDELGKDLQPVYINNPIVDTYQAYTECNLDLIKRNLGFEPKFDIKFGIKCYLRHLLNK